MIPLAVERAFFARPRLYVPATGCWLWLVRGGHVAPRYPQIHINGVFYAAHRVGLELKLGREIKDGYYACHSCDTPPCVHIGHLSEDLPCNNTAAMLERGRHVAPHLVGETNGRARLTPDEVRAIRFGYRRGSHDANAEVLAAQFGVGPTTIRDIVHEKTWRH